MNNMEKEGIIKSLENDGILKELLSQDAIDLLIKEIVKGKQLTIKIGLE